VGTARDFSRVYAPGPADAMTKTAADTALATGDTGKRTLVAVISH